MWILRVNKNLYRWLTEVSHLKEKENGVDVDRQDTKDRFYFSYSRGKLSYFHKLEIFSNNVYCYGLHRFDLENVLQYIILRSEKDYFSRYGILSCEYGDVTKWQSRQILLFQPKTNFN